MGKRSYIPFPNMMSPTHSRLFEDKPANLERELRMSLLQIYAQSHGRFFEVSPEEIENTELAIEDAVGHILLELFDEESVEVDEVTVQFSPISRKGQRDCFIHIQTKCSPASFKLAPCSEEYLRAVVATDVCTVLKEFFGSVTIERVSVQPSFIGVQQSDQK